MAKQSAVEWLIEQLQAPCKGIPSHIIEQAKQKEANNEYEIKAFWFGRGILAGKEGRINELKPTRNH